MPSSSSNAGRLRQAIIAVHVAAFLFGMPAILGELLQVSAVSITAGRAVFAALALLPWLLYRPSSLRQGMSGQALLAIVLSGLFLGIHWITFFVAIKLSGVAITTLGFASFPVFITLLEGVFFKERPSVMDWMAVALVTLGLVLIVPRFDLANQSTVGFVWALLSGLTFAMFTLANRKAVGHISAMTIACLENLVVVVLTGYWFWQDLGSIRSLDWLWLILLGVFCTGLSHALLAACLRVLRARMVGIVLALEPVYAIIFAALLFAQYPNGRMVAGGSIIVLTIMGSSWYGQRTHTHDA